MKDRNTNRKYFIMAMVAFATIILLIRLFYLQVIDDSYRLSAENNVLRYVTQFPARGLIYSRNGEILVSNQAAYDVMVIPNQVTGLDTASLCSLLNIDLKSFAERMANARRYSRQAPSVFLKMLSSEDYARLQENLYLFPGFYVQARTLRKYAKPIAGHILGYVGEVDDRILAEEPYYRSGDYIGISGIEKSYEEQLRGKKGVKVFLVDVLSRVKGSYGNGDFDTLAVPGKNIIITIDADLQEYGEKLMSGKTGSIVVLEPSTGEVLALVSAPTYDPGLLVGRVRSEQYRMLQNDTIKPLFNRALMASYPPGSTFKLINGLIALQENLINTSTSFGCNMGYHIRGLSIGCHSHRSPLNLTDAISNSCNAYFCNVLRYILENPKYGSVSDGYDSWREWLVKFGFGSKLGGDFTSELSGFVPMGSYYDRFYGKGRWKAPTVLSLAIGQGELGTTPLQMANMTAAIANRGYYYTPHLVREIGGGEPVNEEFLKRHETEILPEHFEKIIKGMEDVVNGEPGATARHVAMKDIIICGKTGTAQNPHGDDHSIFIAFAPKENPKIAIAVYVENVGFGSTIAAPVASLMIEKYLTGEITRKYMEDNILNFVKKSGTKKE